MDRPGQAPKPRLIGAASAGAVLAAFSGGLDSSVLLHLLAADPRIRHAGLRAIHVHHGLHADADAWAAHCQAACDALQVPLVVVRVEVDRGAGLGMEGAAREARHRAFADCLRDGEILALAHHRDDQAETFLLRALRGSGVDGLASMTAWRRHGHGWLWRPLLDTDRATLRSFANGHGVDWIEDPGNSTEEQDRNFLRNRVMPLLRERWPHAAGSFARSARLAGEASTLLDDADEAALAAVQDAANALDVVALQALPAGRRARVLRRWIAAQGLPPLPAEGVARIADDLLPAADDAPARFDWNGARVQRWRGSLHAGLIEPALALYWSAGWDGRAPLLLPTGDTLALHGTSQFDAPLRVHARRGGERIQLPGRVHAHALKHVLQDGDVPPARRARMPLLSDHEGLLAAGDAILSARMAAWLHARGARLEWRCVA